MAQNFKCVVHGCPGRDSRDVHLFRIPEEDKDVWCSNLKILPESLNTHDRVCSRHFANEWIGKRKAKLGARPTLALGK